MVSHLPAVQINLKFLRTIQIPTKYLDLLLKVLSKTKAFELPGIAVLTSCLEPQPHTVEHIPCWTLKAIEDYVRDVGYVGFVSHSSIFPVLSSTFFVGKKRWSTRILHWLYRPQHCDCVMQVPLATGPLNPVTGMWHTNLHQTGFMSLQPHITKGTSGKVFTTTSGHYKYLMVSYG